MIKVMRIIKAELSEEQMAKFVIHPKLKELKMIPDEDAPSKRKKMDWFYNLTQINKKYVTAQ